MCGPMVSAKTSQIALLLRESLKKNYDVRKSSGAPMKGVIVQSIILREQ